MLAATLAYASGAHAVTLAGQRSRIAPARSGGSTNSTVNRSWPLIRRLDNAGISRQVRLRRRGRLTGEKIRVRSRGCTAGTRGARVVKKILGTRGRASPESRDARRNVLASGRSPIEASRRSRQAQRVAPSLRVRRNSAARREH